jgi:hypothetical protein
MLIRRSDVFVILYNKMFMGSTRTDQIWRGQTHEHDIGMNLSCTPE